MRVDLCNSVCLLHYSLPLTVIHSTEGCCCELCTSVPYFPFGTQLALISTSAQGHSASSPTWFVIPYNMFPFYQLVNPLFVSLLCQCIYCKYLPLNIGPFCCSQPLKLKVTSLNTYIGAL